MNRIADPSVTIWASVTALSAGTVVVVSTARVVGLTEMKLVVLGVRASVDPPHVTSVTSLSAPSRTIRPDPAVTVALSPPPSVTSPPLITPEAARAWMRLSNPVVRWEGKNSYWVSPMRRVRSLSRSNTRPANTDPPARVWVKVSVITLTDMTPVAESIWNDVVWSRSWQESMLARVPDPVLPMRMPMSLSSKEQAEAPKSALSSTRMVSDPPFEETRAPQRPTDTWVPAPVTLMPHSMGLFGEYAGRRAAGANQVQRVTKT